MTVLITHIEVSSGLLKATDLYKELQVAAPPAVSRKPTMGSSATFHMRGKSNLQTLGEVSSSILAADLKESECPKDSETQPDEDDVQSFSNSLVLSKLKKCLSLSMIARLSKNSIWVPLGGISCVRKAMHRTSMRREDENWPTFSPSEIWIMSVAVDWAPSTEMLISNFYTILPGLRRLPDVLLGRRRDAKVLRLRKVLVAPSGLLAMYCGLVNEIEEGQDTNVGASPRHSLDHMPISDALLVQKKRSIVTRLAQQSIKLSNDEIWVRLQNIKSIHAIFERHSGDFTPSNTFLWPASLCFCIAETFPYEDRCVAFGQDSLTDPLVDAENWFMGKGARTEAIEANRRRKEAEAEKCKEEQNRTIQDAFTYVLPRPAQYGSTQDVASIYPTPPDGIPSQTVLNTTQRPTPAAYGEAVGEEQLDGVDAEAHPIESPLASNLAPVIGSTIYDQLEDDLYADVDTDMFAAKDLTEADLDFFDEPRVNNNTVLTEDYDTQLSETFSEKFKVSGSQPDLGILNDIVSEGGAEPTTKGNVIGQEMLRIGTVNFTLPNDILTWTSRCKISVQRFNQRYIRKSSSFAGCLQTNIL